MRAWQRAEFDFTCGACGERKPIGSPQFSVTLPNVKHPRLRCVACAWEPAPAALPFRLPEPEPMIATHVDDDGLERPGHAPMAQIVALSDWKQKASGS